jgi:hypothetical protein
MENSEELLTESKVLLLLAGKFADDLVEAEPNPIQRATWIVYALKALADSSTQNSYEQMLRQVRDAISTRLESGDW